MCHPSRKLYKTEETTVLTEEAYEYATEVPNEAELFYLLNEDILN